jgi:hypothetical protein
VSWRGHPYRLNDFTPYLADMSYTTSRFHPGASSSLRLPGARFFLYHFIVWRSALLTSLHEFRYHWTIMAGTIG